MAERDFVAEARKADLYPVFPSMDGDGNQPDRSFLFLTTDGHQVRVRFRDGVCKSVVRESKKPGPKPIGIWVTSR